MFVLTSMSWRQVYSVDPCGYQHVASGVVDLVSFSSFFPVQVGDAMLIDLVALYSPLPLRLASVRSMLYTPFQSLLTHIQAGAPPPPLWEGPINSICQLVIILMANIFLAYRSVDIQV
jgi:hypothetical protein